MAPPAAASPTRHAAVLFAVCGPLGLLGVVLPHGPHTAGVVIGLVDLALAALIWVLPWSSLPARASLGLALPALGIIAAANATGLNPAQDEAVMFILVFVWVGTHYPPWSSLLVAPAAAVAYVGGTVGGVASFDPRAAFMVVFTSVLVAETVARGRARLVASEAELARLARHDALTGLPNRSLLTERLAQATEGAAPTVLFVDLDGFKAVNDRYGHDAGDRLLSQVGARLSDAVRDFDVVGRWGGDEFVVILEGVTSEPYALGLADRISAELARPFRLGQTEVRIGASVGVASGVVGGDGRALLAQADQSMYASKADRRAAQAGPASAGPVRVAPAVPGL